MALKIQVEIWEYGRGWGSIIDEVLDFDSREEAESYITEYNGKNDDAQVPDIYWSARLGKTVDR